MRFPSKCFFVDQFGDVVLNAQLACINIFQRFGAFMAPLTSGRVTIAASAIYMSKVTII